MSSTLATELATLREMLRDTDAANYVFSDNDANRTLVNQGLQLSAEVGQAQLWVAGAFTLPTDGSDALLPSTVQYEQVLQLKLPAIGRLLRHISLAEVERMRQGVQSASGDPSYYALYEDSSTATTKLFARFGNIPSIARSVDLFRAALPAVTYTGGSSVNGSERVVRDFLPRMALLSELISRSVLPQ